MTLSKKTPPAEQPVSIKLALPIVASAAVLAVGLTAPAWAADPPNVEEMVESVSSDAVYSHLEDLQELANANGGNRVASSSGDDATMDWIDDTLTEAGYEVTRQQFSFTYSELVLNEVTVNGEVVAGPLPMTASPNSDGVISGTLVEPIDEDRLGCTAEAFDEEVAGNVALVSRGVCSFGEKSLAASAAGAVGLIVYNNEAGNVNGTLGEANPDFVVSYGITQAYGQELRDLVAAGPTTVTLNLEQLIEDRPAYNLLADTPEGDPDNVVVAGAHFDGAPEGPGINDNGSGTAALLETAVQIREYPDNITNKVRFAFWGAEEWGLLGSEYYVDDLAANDPEELDRISSYLNFDMIASPNYIVGVYDADESTYTAPVPVPAGSAEIEKVMTDRFDSLDQPWVDTEFSGRSDYAAFIDANIPSGGLFSGADGSKTAAEVELFGGTPGVPYDANYHTADDTLANLNRESLDIFVPALAYWVFSLAYDAEPIDPSDPTTDPSPSDPSSSDPGSGDPSDEPSDDSSPSSSAPGSGSGGGHSTQRPPLADTGAASALLPALIAGVVLAGGGLALISRRSRNGS